VKKVTHFFFVYVKLLFIFDTVLFNVGFNLEYRWTFRNKSNEETIHEFARTLKIPVSLANVLAARGVASVAEAEKFFKPSLEDLHDPFLMKNMDRAVDRIFEAIERKGLIWVHGDYDVDGTASTSLMLQFLRSIGAKVDYYIPDRFEEGYGLSKKSIDTAKKKGAEIVMTVDVGITSVEYLNYAKSKGIDCIICDHHEPGEVIPDVYAIIDPLQEGDIYPFKHLSACGVAFKVAQAISQRLNKPELTYPYLDLVAIASAADMVPLIGENRILVHFGLEKLNNNPHPGLKGLIECTNLKLGQITTSNIIYALAPLINAAGRMGDALRSVNMMIEKDETQAFMIAQKLEQENRRRRVFDQQTFEEAIPLAKKLLDGKDRRSLVLHAPHWHAGVIGIVASRLVDMFNLPTILLTSIDNIAKGSARSISGFDIHKALKTCSDLLIEYGGHKHAAGLTLKEENVEELRERIDALAQEKITRDMLVPEILLDAELRFNELSPKFLDILNSFSPYGFENYKPVFYTKSVKTVNGIKVFGANNLRFRAMQSNFAIDALAYGLADKISICNNGKSFSIVYNIEFNVINGQKTPQILIKDLRPDNWNE
jgi:single-stranded-DNA-specific exonuclease